PERWPASSSRCYNEGHPDRYLLERLVRMELDPNQFVESATIAIHDIQLQSALTRSTGNAVRNRQTALAELPHTPELRQQGRGAKLRALDELPDLLERFERNATANGATVLWAEDAAEANQRVIDICLEKNLKLGVKSKS